MNSVCIIGNLTKDPELRQTPGGTSVATLRIAVNDRYKDSSGEWTDRPYYFNVDVWGNRADTCVQYLSRGKKIAVTGKLTWREWEAQDGTKRQDVSINAHDVQFLTPRGENDGGGNQFVPAGAQQNDAWSNADDDIPF